MIKDSCTVQLGQKACLPGPEEASANESTCTGAQDIVPLQIDITTVIW